MFPLYEPNIHYHTLPYFILGDANALLKIDSISPADGSLNKQTKLNVQVTSTSTYQDASMTALVELVLKKKVLWWYQAIPNFVYGMAKTPIEKFIPGVEYVKDK